METKKAIKSLPKLWFLCFIIIFSLAITSTLGWFALNTEVKIVTPTDENLAIQINSGDLLVSYSILVLSDGIAEYSDFTSFGSTLLVNAEMPKFIDVTGDGNNLYWPTTMYEDGNGDADPHYTDGENWQDVTTAVGYSINVKLKFSTSQTMDIYLDNESGVFPLENVLGTSFARSSGLGNFSADGIAGCARVAFFEVTEEGGEEVETLKFVWIPNDKYCLTYVNDTPTMSLSGPREDEYLYYLKSGDRMSKTLYTDQNIVDGDLVVGDGDLAIASSAIVNGATPLVSFTANGEVQEKEILVRIWFEGTDREADTALDGGIVRYNLSFTGINKSEVSAETQTKIDSVVYDSGLRYGSAWNGASCEPIDGVCQVQYSYDGIDWTNYGTGATLDTTKDYAYVRSCETATTKVSAVKKVLLHNN